MRGVFFIFLMGAQIGGCSGADMMRPPSEPSMAQGSTASLSVVSGTLDAGSALVVADAIDRLVPALGPRGAGLGTSLRQLRDDNRLDLRLIDAVGRQLGALKASLPPESIPDADALELALDALRGASGT